jgi:hypothetical protein
MSFDLMSDSDEDTARQTDRRDEHVFTINLDSDWFDSRTLAGKRANTSDVQTSLRSFEAEFAIAASTVHKSGFDDEFLRIVTQQPYGYSGKRSAEIDRWL